MAPSFRKIDYSVRPAKHAERKMLLEIFRHFSVFAPMREYRYVGLGSVWFSDFQLFHRALGIPDMISIEREKNAEARIRKNIPFAAITPIFKPRTSLYRKCNGISASWSGSIMTTHFPPRYLTMLVPLYRAQCLEVRLLSRFSTSKRKKLMRPARTDLLSICLDHGLAAVCSRTILVRTTYMDRRLPGYPEE